MIKIAFFDLGETLIHEGAPFPGVIAALRAVTALNTATGQPLVLGIISDYDLPTLPPTEEKITALEQQYRNQALAPSGLAEFFQPFESRVTISSRAGVFKPNQAIFDMAVARSGTGAALNECLFVTENRSHLEKCAEYGITPVRFGAGGVLGGMAGFSDWADASAVLRGLVSPEPAVVTAGTALALDEQHGLVDFHPTGGDMRTLHGRAGRLVQLSDARLGRINGVYVEIPTDVTVELSPDGQVASATAAMPVPDEVSDALSFVLGLVRGDRVAVQGETTPLSTPTHVVEQDSVGRPRLVRRRYSTH